jgi:hypothetical protein
MARGATKPENHSVRAQTSFANHSVRAQTSFANHSVRAQTSFAGEEARIANETRIAKLNQSIGAAQTGFAQPSAKFQMGGPQQPGPIYECPFCKNCNQSNNAFQQRVIDQAVWPRPRWVPQGVETQGDPYATRYRSSASKAEPYFSENFGNVRSMQYPMIEHFTDEGGKTRENFSQQGGENILRLILWLLISLFAIQLVDLVLKLILV